MDKKDAVDVMTIIYLTAVVIIFLTLVLFAATTEDTSAGKQNPPLCLSR